MVLSRRMTMKTTILACLLVALGACQRTPELDVRTFAVEHLTADVVEGLLYPYVYEERPGAPGRISVTETAVTVRETPENLERIARVLAEHDVARPDTRLIFQLIEADGFTDADPRIADVVEQLRSAFQFRGYRLAGEAVVTVTNRSEVQQQIRAADGVYLITTGAEWVSTGAIRLEEVTLWSTDSNPILMTTVNVRPGQTLVLGSSPGEGSTATLLLTVRAEEAP
jgi:hypothetical protein